MIRSMKRAALALVLLALVIPATSPGSEPVRAGVVTTLLGSATITRASTPEAAPLKFRDPVFLNDRVTTAENSLARILLGGKALVTVREKSVLHLTEVPGASTIELADGRLALAVVKERMRPGDLIEIRTPNAVAGIRGTIAIAEHAGGISTFMVLRGQIDVANLNQARQVVGQRVIVNVNERVSVRPNAPLVPQRLAPEVVRKLGGDYQVSTTEGKAVDAADGTPGATPPGLDKGPDRGGDKGPGGRGPSGIGALPTVVPGVSPTSGGPVTSGVPGGPGGPGGNRGPLPIVTPPPIQLPQDKHGGGKTELPEAGRRGGSGRK